MFIKLGPNIFKYLSENSPTAYPIQKNVLVLSQSYSVQLQRRWKRIRPCQSSKLQEEKSAKLGKATRNHRKFIQPTIINICFFVAKLFFK